MSVGLALSLTAVLVLLNAFFVMAEFAIIKVRRSKVEELIRQGRRRAVTLQKLTDNLEAALPAIQLGVTMASLGIGWLGEPAVAQSMRGWLHRLPIDLQPAAAHSISFAVAFVAITFIHVVAGELVPKSIAIRYPTSTALFSSYPLTVFSKIFYVPMRALNASSMAILTLLRLRGENQSGDASHSEEELRILLAQSQEHGKMPLSRLLLFENLFDFSRATVRDVMTPPSLVAALKAVAPWEENQALIKERRYSRYPLIGRDLNDVLGVVHIKDILMATGTPDLIKLRRDVLVIGDSTPLERTLNPLRSRHANMAVVKNKLGQVVGLLTLEDVLEELVGEIEDEFSPPRVLLFANMINEGGVDLQIQGQTKEEMFRALLRKMLENRPGLRFDTVWRALWEREMSLTSAVGRAIAIPHARIANIDMPILGVGRLAGPQDFGAPDKKPVRLVFMILTPQHLPGAQVRLLARIAGLSAHRTVFRRLLNAKTPKEVIEVLTAYDQTNPE